ncbi:MAG TPA: alpha-L-fucosidase [Hymenobacter sp.]|jgi:alpha-L-fucosidase|uniref:alpha-L-fucosidase n=1 Tax=Hymenobacter sp. TaxID=1898978 RepID=UPI002EDA650C
MQKNTCRLLATSLLAGLATAAQAQTAKPAQQFQPTWESLKNYQAPEWFRDAKFGIFIHWGPYAVPASYSEWYPREMYHQDSKTYKYHQEKYGPQAKFGYKDFISMFTADKFNADQWLDVFKKSGAKYIVPVAEHHDGFAMYKTKLTKWNAAEMGPKRDVVGELAAATRKQGLVFGVSSHRIEHWWFFGFGQQGDSDVKDPQYADFYGPANAYDPFKKGDKAPTMSAEFMQDWQARTTELVDNYQPQLVWFDWWIEQPELEPYKQKFASYYYNKGLDWNKGVVINYKNNGFPEGTAVYDIERSSSKATKKYPWQTDTSVGKKSWGYIEGEDNKSPNELIDELIDVVSKNGNLLLNIGPKADGTITPEQTAVLLGMGKWLAVNGEGIYGTRPWAVAGEGPTEGLDENVRFNEYAHKGYTAQDVRFTRKGKTVYAFGLDVPKTATTMKALAAGKNGKVSNVQLLGSQEKVRWAQGPTGLVVQPLRSYPTAHAVGYKITLQ